MAIIESALSLAASHFRQVTVGHDMPPGNLNCPRCNVTPVPDEKLEDLRRGRFRTFRTNREDIRPQGFNPPPHPANLKVWFPGRESIKDFPVLCYLLCRSLNAKRVVEAGTSYGVSTLYLAAAVRDNQVENGIVIGTEHEPRKVEIAKANFEQADLSEFIDLREGDLRETLLDVDGPVDFMLVDIWEVALPALELVSPSLRPGAIVACDNTEVDLAEYRDYFKFLHDPINRFRTMTVPFKGGFELSVRI